MPGKLYVVPTPIGNLEDITLRAIRVLGEVELVLAEDTRVSGQLLAHLGIDRPLRSFHAHNEHHVLQGVVDKLKAGAVFALVSDAGTFGISDPGFLLVRACLEAGVPVETLPGPTAFVPALVSSGLPCDRFVFEGFLPVKKGRRTRLQLLAAEQRTIVFYESPHRIERTLRELAEVLGGERRAAVARELSKLHEEVLRGTLAELAAHFAATAARGEIVLCVAGADDRRVPQGSEDR